MAVLEEITQQNDCTFSQSSLDIHTAKWHLDSTV